MLAALARLDHAAAADLADESETHVRQGGEAVFAGLLLHLRDDVLERVQLVLVQMQGLAHQLIALDKLGRREAQGDAGALGVVLDQMRDRVNTAVQGACIRTVRRAEVQAAGALAMARHVQGVLDQLAGALVLGGGNGDHGDAEHALEQVDVDGAAVCRDLVHHVEGENHGAVELHELHGEVEVALDIGGVHDVDDGIRARGENEVAADDLLAGVG